MSFAFVELEETPGPHMADDDKGRGESTSRGNEWEVVSLTASTYAAAPGPKEAELSDFEKGNDIGKNEDKSSAMFMSDHFIFPPSEHENLPLDLGGNKIHNEPIDEVLPPSKVPVSHVEEGDMSNRKDNDWSTKEMTEADEFPGIQFFNEKGEITTLQDAVDEQNMYSAANFSSFQAEGAVCGSTHVENAIFSELIDPSQNLDHSSDISGSLASSKDDKYDLSGLPCEAWWKRQAASLFSRAKEANTFWSIFVAAALMGLVILGQRWQQESWQLQQLKRQLSVRNEKMNWVLGPISRFKDVIIGGHRQGSLIRGSTPTAH